MKRIIISRTDSIGDVLLTLPMVGLIKEENPGCEILFLGKSYTGPVIEACRHVDRFINWDSLKDLPYSEQKEHFRSFGAEAIIHVFPNWLVALLADAVNIPVRIGTAHRLVSWMLCNEMVWFSRKRSSLHEAQLNLKLLKPLGVDRMLTLEEIPDYYGMAGAGHRALGTGHSAQGTGKKSKDEVSTMDPGSRIPDPGSLKFRLILHPKSKGSAREWGLENFSRLIELLPPERFEIFITGTSEEQAMMKDFLKKHQSRVTDMTGKHTLPELMQFIGSCDGLIAASTGPLHLAAALGKLAIGLYAPMRPIDPGRWAPLGIHATYLVLDKNCNDCRKHVDCHCIREITPESVVEKLQEQIS